jgi:hypothetical protein
MLTVRHRFATFFHPNASYDGAVAGKLKKAKLALQGEKWLD